MTTYECRTCGAELFEIDRPDLIALVAHRLWTIGNNRIGHRDWDVVAEVYTAEATEVVDAVLLHIDGTSQTP